MKVFITGSAGFIGKNLVNFYSNEKIFKFHRNMDLKKELEDFSPDLIINCAADIYDESKMWDSNVEMVRDCLEFCLTRKKIKMIQIGSSSEYGPMNVPTREDMPLNPTGMYAGTKGIATILCQTYASTYGVNVIILRPYSPYGPEEKPHRLFPNLWKSFKLNQPMNLVMGVHDFCYIDDFIDAISLIVDNNIENNGEIFNVSSGIQTSNLEVFDTFKSITGSPGNVSIVDYFSTPPIWQCDNSKIKERYGWYPKINLEYGIKLFLERASYE